MIYMSRSCYQNKHVRNIKKQYWESDHFTNITDFHENWSFKKYTCDFLETGASRGGQKYHLLVYII